MEIREANSTDCADIADISIESWRFAYAGIMSDDILQNLDAAARTAGWRGIVESGGTIFLAIENNRAIGFAHVCAYRGGEPELQNMGEITAIYFRPEFIQQGYGKQLFCHASGYLRAQSFPGLLVWALARNNRAVAFYQAMGLKWDGGTKIHGSTGLAEHRFRLDWSLGT